MSTNAITTTISSRREEAGTAASGTAVPAPTICLTCGGDGVRLRLAGDRVVTEPCPGCRCWCGAATDTPPECRRCAIAEDSIQTRRADQ